MLYDFLKKIELLREYGTVDDYFGMAHSWFCISALVAALSASLPLSIDFVSLWPEAGSFYWSVLRGYWQIVVVVVLTVFPVFVIGLITSPDRFILGFPESINRKFNEWKAQNADGN